VRLDNRAEVLRLIGASCDMCSDLQLVLAAIDACGADVVQKLHGDFAFVAWDARAQKIIAARDAFGVKSLFMRRTDGMLVFSSRAATLATSETYDVSYLRDFLFGLPDPGTRTAWSDVKRLEAGTVFQQRGTGDTTRRYWSAENFTPAADADERESVEQFRELFTNAVQQRIDTRTGTWAQLSGGLDSSAVVSVAEGIVGAGSLSGTVTVVDTLGSGDERTFSELVVQKYGLRNEQVQDAWAWEDAGRGFIASDEPNSLYPFALRDLRMRSVVLSNQGRVLLSGFGADHYLFGNLSYIPDMILSGRIFAAARELAGWSLARQQSFWTMARRHAIAPLLGRATVGRRTEDSASFPRWLGDSARVTRDFNRIYNSHALQQRGRMFVNYTAREMASIPAWVQRDGFEDGMEVRYPFLSRPLVEFSLQLPVHLRVQPFARKRVLREAMRGVLPEQIRTRQSKGGIDARILWSLQRENGFLRTLLQEPILADLGVLDGAELRSAVAEARNGIKHNVVMLMSALSLETWLAVRSGRLALQRKAA
jgi:asparagine synthase (glutamine-hydrolysing)